MAYALGNLIGLLIMIAVVVGVTLTLTRSDLSWKQKLVGGPDQGSAAARHRPLLLLGAVVLVGLVVVVAAQA